MSDLTKNICIPENLDNSDEIWQKAYKKWETEKPEKNSRFSGLSNAENLKNECISIYKEKYSSAFYSKKELFADTIKYCSINIKDLLDENKRIRINGKGEDKKEIFEKIIQSEEDSTENTILKQAKQNWEILRDWCINSYEKKYTHENKEILDLANKYCVDNAVMH